VGEACGLNTMIRGQTQGSAATGNSTIWESPRQSNQENQVSSLLKITAQEYALSAKGDDRNIIFPTIYGNSSWLPLLP